MLAGSSDSALRDVETAVLRLPGVTAARIVEDPLGVPSEVHVLSDGSKQPKQLVRDIQSIALAGHGISLDHRIISVVPVPSGMVEAAGVAAEPRLVERRIAVEGIGVWSTATSCNVDVTLRVGTREATGRSEGSSHPPVRARLVATAAVDALARLHDAAGRLVLDAVQVIELGERRVVVVGVGLPVHNGQEVVIGSSVSAVGADDGAVVRAVLDATNRRLPKLFPTIAL